MGCAVILGRDGLADLVDRCCRLARQFADGLEEAGYSVLNDIVLNQVLVSFGSADKTMQVIEAVQNEGTMWASGTEWQGNAAMRISVSSWATSEDDIEQSLVAIKRVMDALD